MKKVLVIRDPKDVVASSYHFLAGVAMGPAVPPMSVIATMFENGVTAECPWWESALNTVSFERVAQV